MCVWKIWRTLRKKEFRVKLFFTMKQRPRVISYLIFAYDENKQTQID